MSCAGAPAEQQDPGAELTDTCADHFDAFVVCEWFDPAVAVDRDSVIDECDDPSPETDEACAAANRDYLECQIGAAEHGCDLGAAAECASIVDEQCG